MQFSNPMHGQPSYEHVRQQVLLWLKNPRGMSSDQIWKNPGKGTHWSGVGYVLTSWTNHCAIKKCNYGILSQILIPGARTITRREKRHRMDKNNSKPFLDVIDTNL